MKGEILATNCRVLLPWAPNSPTGPLPGSISRSTQGRAKHCCRFPKDDQRKIVFQDPTVPSHQEMSPGFEALKDFPEKSRIIHPTDFPVCSYAYAVTYEGAQKVLCVLTGASMLSQEDLATGCIIVADRYVPLSPVTTPVSTRSWGTSIQTWQTIAGYI